MLKPELLYFKHIKRRQDSLEKIIMLGKVEGSRKRGKPNVRWILPKGATGLSLQELKRTAEDRAFWRLLIHRFPISRRNLDST